MVIGVTFVERKQAFLAKDPLRRVPREAVWAAERRAGADWKKGQRYHDR